jgi:hypothetical protein
VPQLQVGCRREVDEVTYTNRPADQRTVTAAWILGALEVREDFRWRRLGELHICSVKLKNTITKKITRMDAEDCEFSEVLLQITSSESGEQIYGARTKYC